MSERANRAAIREAGDKASSIEAVIAVISSGHGGSPVRVPDTVPVLPGVIDAQVISIVDQPAAVAAAVEIAPFAAFQP